MGRLQSEQVQTSHHLKDKFQNKKKAFESKYNELRRQVQSTKRPESISQRLGGKENFEA